jgi:hypothetical protein
MKENNRWIGIVIIILIFSTGAILTYQIDKLPKKYCYTETNVSKIVVDGAFYLNYTNKNNMTSKFWFSEGLAIYDENDDILCEDGVYYYWGQIQNFNDETKYCLATHKKEVCEIK